MVWSDLPFIRSGQNYLARHSERGKKTRRTEVEVGRQHQGTDRPGVRQVPEGSGEQGKMEETGCETICGAPATLAVKGSMMMMMMMTLNRPPRSIYELMLFSFFCQIIIIIVNKNPRLTQSWARFCLRSCFPAYTSVHEYVPVYSSTSQAAACRR